MNTIYGLKNEEKTDPTTSWPWNLVDILVNMSTKNIIFQVFFFGTSIIYLIVFANSTVQSIRLGNYTMVYNTYLPSLFSLLFVSSVISFVPMFMEWHLWVITVIYFIYPFIILIFCWSIFYSRRLPSEGWKFKSLLLNMKLREQKRKETEKEELLKKIEKLSFQHRYLLNTIVSNNNNSNTNTFSKDGTINSKFQARNSLLSSSSITDSTYLKNELQYIIESTNFKQAQTPFFTDSYNNNSTHDNYNSMPLPCTTISNKTNKKIIGSVRIKCEEESNNSDNLGSLDDEQQLTNLSQNNKLILNNNKKLKEGRKGFREEKPSKKSYINKLAALNEDETERLYKSECNDSLSVLPEQSLLPQESDSMQAQILSPRAILPLMVPTTTSADLSVPSVKSSVKFSAQYQPSESLLFAQNTEDSHFNNKLLSIIDTPIPSSATAILQQLYKSKKKQKQNYSKLFYHRIFCIPCRAISKNDSLSTFTTYLLSVVVYLIFACATFGCCYLGTIVVKPPVKKSTYNCILVIFSIWIFISLFAFYSAVINFVLSFFSFLFVPLINMYRAEKKRHEVEKVNVRTGFYISSILSGEKKEFSDPGWILEEKRKFLLTTQSDNQDMTTDKIKKRPKMINQRQLYNINDESL